MKGYHVEIPFGPIEPADHVPGTLRRFCQGVVDELRVATFDTSVYDRTRLWRCWISRHEKTGRFKRRLNLDELLYLDHDRHAELIRVPLAFQAPAPVCSDLLDQDWNVAGDAARAERQQHHTEVARHRGGALTDVAWWFLVGQATRPGRHNSCIHAAAVLARAGCPKGLAFDLLFRAATSCDMSGDYGRGEVLRAIENAWKRGLDELERHTDDDSFE